MSQIIPPGDWAIETLALPAAEPMTLATAKLQCRVPTAITEYDALLSDAISAARNYIESTFANYLAKQRVRITFASFPQGDRFRLPVWPIQTIDAMDYVTADGVAHFLNVGEVDTAPVPDVIARLWRKPAEMVLPFAHIWPPATLQIGGAIRITTRGMRCISIRPGICRCSRWCGCRASGRRCMTTGVGGWWGSSRGCWRSGR